MIRTSTSGWQLPQQTHLAVLAGDVPLVERRDLQVAAERRQVEVRGEGQRRAAVGPRLEHEGGGLVLPLDPVEVEQRGQLGLGVVGEVPGGPADRASWTASRVRPSGAQLPLTAARPPAPAPARRGPKLDGVVHLAAHVVEGEQVEHALAACG